MMRSTPQLLVVLVGLAGSVASAACLHYEGKPVVLSGVLITRTFYGPPSYGETPKGDARETQALLRLDKPICVENTPGKANAVYDRADQQKTITLIPNWKSVKPYLRRRVEVSGLLSGALAGHHHTAVLMEVRTIKVTE